MGRIKDLTSALPTETDAFVFDGANGTKKLTYNNLKQVLIDDVSDDIEEEIRQIYVIDNELDESSAHAVANSAVAGAVNANSRAIDSINGIMSSMQTSQNNLIDRVDDLDEDVDGLKDSVVSPYETKHTNGDIASFKNGAGDIPLKSLVVSIDPKQAGSGDPSPTNIRPITSFDAAKITVSNKNLVALTDREDIRTDTTFTASSNGTVTLNGSSAAQRFQNYMYSIGKCPFPRNVPLKVIGGGSDGGSVLVRVCCFYYNSTTTINVATSQASTPEPTFTITDDMETVWLRVASAAGGEYNNRVVYPQIVLASEADTTFEVGNRIEYPVSFGAAGTVYEGTLDVTTGMLTVNAVGRTFDGTESWSQQYTSPNRVFRYVFSEVKTDSTKNLRRACSHFPNASIISTTTAIGFYAYTSGANNNVWFQFRPDLGEIPDLTSWKAWLAQQYSNGTPLQAFVPIITPVSYQLTPTEVITILGQNNIWSDTGSVIECEYRRDLQEQLMSTLVTESASGNVASFDDGADDIPVKSLIINITAQQSGTGDPSPSNVRVISGFDSVNVTVAADNLFDGQWVCGRIDNTTGIPIAESTSTTFIRALNYVPVERNTQYTFIAEDGFDMTNGTLAIYGYSQDHTFNEFVYNSALDGSATFNTGNNDVILFRFYRSVGNGGIANVETAKFTLREGTSTEMVDYVGTTYPISLSSAGTVYGGTLDVTTGVLTVTYSSFDMGNVTWSYYTSGDHPVFRRNQATPPRKYGYNSEGITGMCNAYKFYGNATLATIMTSMADKSFGFQSTNSWVAVRDDDYTDVNAFTTANAGNIIVYPLETPVSYQLSSTEIQTILGDNNVWADTGSVASCEYRADTNILVNKLINAIISLGGNI